MDWGFRMRAQLLELVTAMAWGFCGYFEKKGLHLGQLSPQVGILLRTPVAGVLLGLVSFPQWKTMAPAGPRSLTYTTPPSRAHRSRVSCRSRSRRRSSAFWPAYCSVANC